MVAATSLLAGCSMSSMNPVNWWHQQEGGQIAKQRPAPPGVDQPYPNLSTVPAKPEAPNEADLKKLTDSLIADRTNAQHAAQAAPIPDPSSPAASPSLFGIGSAPPPPPPGSTQAQVAAPVASATMPAVTAPPPAPAPRKAVQSAPLSPQPAQTTAAPTAPATEPAAQAPSVAGPAPARAPAPTAASPRAAALSPAAASPPAAATPPTQMAAAAQPPLPEAPPPRPAIAGAPPPAPPAPSPMPATGAKSAEIVFVPDSSELSQAAGDEVKAFAASRGNAVIGVTGYGDTASSDPSAQSAAVNLGLARAQSIVSALRAAGVPGNAIRVSAEASGRGASLHLLQ